MAREETEDLEREERAYKRKRDKMEAKERVEDMVGPKEVGREGMLEKKRAKREADRNFREKGDEGLEADEGTLMGGGDSFQAQLSCFPFFEALARLFIGFLFFVFGESVSLGGMLPSEGTRLRGRTRTQSSGRGLHICGRRRK
jgi:hypothetical protein